MRTNGEDAVDGTGLTGTSCRTVGTRQIEGVIAVHAKEHHYASVAVRIQGPASRDPLTVIPETVIGQSDILVLRRVRKMDERTHTRVNGEPHRVSRYTAAESGILTGGTKDQGQKTKDYYSETLHT